VVLSDSREREREREREELEMTSSTENSSLYVLISSTFGTIVGLAAVWIATAQSFTPVLGA
jgi:hypothetical protein